MIKRNSKKNFSKHCVSITFDFTLMYSLLWVLWDAVVGSILCEAGNEKLLVKAYIMCPCKVSSTKPVLEKSWVSWQDFAIFFIALFARWISFSKILAMLTIFLAVGDLKVCLCSGIRSLLVFWKKTKTARFLATCGKNYEFNRTWFWDMIFRKGFSVTRLSILLINPELKSCLKTINLLWFSFWKSQLKLKILLNPEVVSFFSRLANSNVNMM